MVFDIRRYSVVYSGPDLERRIRSRNMKVVLASTLLLFSGGCMQNRFVRVADSAIPQTVCITVRDGIGGNQGAGVIINARGAILTCSHLFPKNVKDGSITVTTHEGISYGAKLLARKSKRDLAVIKIFEHTPHYAKLGKIGSLKVGQEVVAVGHPFGHDWSVTTGVISALNRDRFQYNMIQMDAVLGPGNSGGGLFNTKGELIGINTGMFTPFPPLQAGLNFAVEIGQITEFLVFARKQQIDG